MSEEDAFLAAIAADRADRTRLLVFADWLAERSDPREEFVRLHTRLLDTDGTEAEFRGLEDEWVRWTGGVAWMPGYLPGPPTGHRLDERWLDAFARVFTEGDVQSHAPNNEPPEVERLGFGQMDHLSISGEEELVLYRGKPAHFRGPFDFATRTVLRDLWDDPFGLPPRHWSGTGSRFLAPVTGGSFWQRWRMHCRGLRNRPPLPVLDPDNHFLGAQYIEGNWNNWCFVAAYRNDYFALFWSTTA